MKKLRFKDVIEMVEDATDRKVTLVRGPRDARDSKVGYHTRYLSNWNTIEHFKTLKDVINRYSK